MKKTIRIKGMSCRHCVMAVTRALENIEGITDVSVDLQKGEASFTETASVDGTVIKREIENAGYEVE